MDHFFRGSPAPSIEVKRFAEAFLKGHGGHVARSHFSQWVYSKGGFTTISELTVYNEIPEQFLYSVSLRLAQGADTNKRGHSATDLIKERLNQYGFSPNIGNTNSSDLAVSEIVDGYSGPRKFDTVIWNARAELAVVCQSQMYSSDSGSIQGKTVEEDYLALNVLREKWQELVVLTNTEGFGCHTAMLSRLKHVLKSDIDGFIQLKTLDTKLRNILKTAQCITLVDYEKVLFSADGFRKSKDNLVQILVASELFPKDEVVLGLERYLDSDLLGFSNGQISIKPDRIAIVAYFTFVDTVTEMAKYLGNETGKFRRVGGLPIESGVEEYKFEAALLEVSNKLPVASSDLNKFEKFVQESWVFSAP